MTTKKVELSLVLLSSNKTKVVHWTLDQSVKALEWTRAFVPNIIPGDWKLELQAMRPSVDYELSGIAIDDLSIGPCGSYCELC